MAKSTMTSRSMIGSVAVLQACRPCSGARISAPVCGPMSWACVDSLSTVVTFVRGAVEG